MRRAAALSLVGAVACVAAGGGGGGGLQRAEFQEKFDLEWAKHVLEDAGSGAARASQEASRRVGSAFGGLEVKALNATSKLGNLTDVLRSATSQLRNASAGIVIGAAREGKELAFTAALAYLGTCREYFALLPAIQQALVPRLAQALQRHASSTSVDACTAAMQEGIQSTIAAYMKGQDGREQAAVEWIASDRAHILCNDKLMRALALYESIRVMFPRQYEEALHDKLLLEVVTEELIATQLDGICGHKGGFRTDGAPARLFATTNSTAVEPVASARARRASIALAVAAASAALVGAWLLALLAARRWKSAPVGLCLDTGARASSRPDSIGEAIE